MALETIVTLGRRRLALAALALPLAFSMGACITACDEQEKDTTVEDVKVGGKTFHLELALDDKSRFQGMSGRTEVKADGGMLFVFPRPARRDFVMRDCPVPIDIIFLDGSGRIVAMHNMTPEEARKESEKVNDPKTGVNDTYERRLKKYSSGYASQFVIELKGNTLALTDVNKGGIKLKNGDKIELDVDGLRKRAK